LFLFCGKKRKGELNNIEKYSTSIIPPSGLHMAKIYY